MYKHPEIDRICEIERRYSMVLSKIIFYLLQDGCRSDRGLMVTIWWHLGLEGSWVVLGMEWSQERKKMTKQLVNSREHSTSHEGGELGTAQGQAKPFQLLAPHELR